MRALRMPCFRARRWSASQASRLEELVVTNTIPLSEAAQQVSKIKVLSIAGLVRPRDREHSHGDVGFDALQLGRVAS